MAVNAVVSFEAAATIAILVGALALFATERVRPPIVALIVAFLLMVSGVLTPAEGTSGFSNPATITILALFLLSGGVYGTGLIFAGARRLVLVAGRHEGRVLLFLVLLVGPLAAFVANTAVVAILIPLVLAVARQARVSPSKLLIPLSYVAQLAGTLTLVGTSTNILTSTLLEQATGRGFGVFEFTRVGLMLFVAGITYLLVVGRRIIPERIPAGEAAESVLARRFVTEVRVLANSPLVGKTLTEYRASDRYNMDVFRVLRRGHAVRGRAEEIPLEPEDVLVLRAPREDLAQIERSAKVEVRMGDPRADLDAESESRVVEVVVSATSTLIRRTVSEAGFAKRFGVRVLGISRRQPSVLRLPLHARRWPAPLGATRLEFGDTLLVQATQDALDELRNDPDFILIEESPIVRFRPGMAIAAVAIVAGVVVIAAFEIYPLLVAALGGAVLMALLGILKGEEMWTTIQWDVIFLLAGLIPLGIAFQKTGLALAVGEGLAASVGGLPDIAIILVFYGVSALLTEVISNFANVVLLVPVALLTAAELAISPVPLVLAVMFAASTSFMTPIGYQTNLMVYGPGGYRFTDFTRVGAPLNLILAIVASVGISLLFPLRG